MIRNIVAAYYKLCDETLGSGFFIVLIIAILIAGIGYLFGDAQFFSPGEIQK